MSAYQFKVQLRGVTDPPIWRRLIVPGDYTFSQLAQDLIIAFDLGPFYEWAFFCYNSNKRMTTIITGETGYAEAVDGFPLDIDWKWKGDPRMNEYEAYVYPIREIEKIPPRYTLDFMHRPRFWIEHKVTLEKVLDEEIAAPRCIEGVGAPMCEDLGGGESFQYFKELYASGKVTDEEREMVEGFMERYMTADAQMDYSFSPEDLDKINDILSGKRQRVIK